MGCDKALLPWGHRSLVEHAVATLEALGIPVALACGSTLRYSELPWPKVLDRIRDPRADEPVNASSGGPLSGLEAGLEAFFHRRGQGTRDGWLLVVGCDQPAVRPEHLEALLARGIEADLDLCGLRSDRGPEPTLAAVRSTCLASIRACLDLGERRMRAFHGGVRGAVVPAAQGGPAAQTLELSAEAATPSDDERLTECDGSTGTAPLSANPTLGSTHSVPGKSLRIDWLRPVGARGMDPGVNLNTPQDYRGAHLEHGRPNRVAPSVSGPSHPFEGGPGPGASAPGFGSEDRLAAAKRP